MVMVILDSIGKNEEFESLAILVVRSELILSLTTVGWPMVFKLTALTINRPGTRIQPEKVKHTFAGRWKCVP